MTFDWSEPRRLPAHRLFREQSSVWLPTTATQRPVLPSRSVEEVFHAGLLADVVLGPTDEVNTRIDTFFDEFRGLPLFDTPVDMPTWAAFGKGANSRRRAAEAFLGQSLEDARNFLLTAPGRFMVRPLPFENRDRRNDTHELLYFRDSGIHRRLVERNLTLGRRDGKRVGARALEHWSAKQLESYVPRRWEAFAVTTIADLVDRRCEAFAYRHEETREIDLVLEWLDRSPPERWAIEVTSRKFNTHPSGYFAEECEFLGVSPANRYVVRRTDDCDGSARGRGGVFALSLPRMVDNLRRRLQR